MSRVRIPESMASRIMRKIEHKEEITINTMIGDGPLLAIALTEEGILITQPNLF